MIPNRIRDAQRLVIIGGARSGKSTLAERVLLDAVEVDYVATSESLATDQEWVERVAQHRDRRPAHWKTLESVDLVGLLAQDGPPLLIDCLTVWLTRLMDRHDAWNDERWPQVEPSVQADIEALISALRMTRRRVVMVTNEVGQGVVPATASVRRFRDQMGWLNQQVAAASDETVLAVAGRFLVLEEWA